MRSSLLHLFEAWLVCTVFGLAVLAPLRRSFRELWLPAAPVLGAAFLVVTLHTTSLFVGVNVGVYIVLAPATALVALGVRRGTRPWLFSLPSLAAGATTSVVGLFGAGLALLPNLSLGSSRIVLPTANHDAFYYVSESVWLAANPIRNLPAVGSGPGAGTASPLATPALQALSLPLRVGQALVSGAVETPFGTDELTAFMPTMAAWVLFMAGAVFVACRLLGLGNVAGVAAAALICGSSLVARAAYDQHTDSLLGIAFVNVTLAAFVVSTFRRHPRWPAVLLTAGLFGTYTEYALFIVPALAAATFLTVGSGYLRRVRRGLGIIGLAVLVSPVIWFRGVKNLLVSQPGGDVFPSPFLTPDPVLSLGRALGTTAIDAPTVPVVLTVALGVLLVVGVALALHLSRYRMAFVGAVGVGAVAVAVATVADRGYLQDRLVTLSLPLVWFTAVAGWSLAVRRLATARSRAGRRVGGALVVGLVASAALTTAAGARTSSTSFDPAVARSRYVTTEYDEVAGWVRELGGPGGDDVTVVEPDLFVQMWVLYELRAETRVSYLSLHPDYLRPEQYWNGEVDHYLLVGNAVEVAGGDAAVIRRTEHFRLVDMTHGPVAVVAPAVMSTWSEFTATDGTISASPGSDLVILRGNQAPDQVDITFSSSLSNLQATLTAADGPASSGTLGPQGQALRVDSRSAPTTRLTLTTTDTRDATRQFRLLGARFPPNP